MTALTRRRSVSELQDEADTDTRLNRALGPLNLLTLGIGAIIGAGIFVLTGQAAAQYAGPAIALSFVISGLGCLFAGLCYAEYAAMIPVSGSAYTYAYATLGEFMAWIIGWDLILEYLFASSTVAVGWSGHVQGFLREFGVFLPPALAQAPFGVEDGSLMTTGALINLPAVGIVLFLTVLLVVGIRESARFNNVMVVTKVVVLVAVILFGVWYLLRDPAATAANWTPFIPDNTGTFGAF
ncbi:MAG: amino acid permease, partial [Candidatus Latescibacterota bacterium]